MIHGSTNIDTPATTGNHTYARNGRPDGRKVMQSTSSYDSYTPWKHAKWFHLNELAPFICVGRAILFNQCSGVFTLCLWRSMTRGGNFNTCACVLFFATASSDLESRSQSLKRILFPYNRAILRAFQESRWNCKNGRCLKISTIILQPTLKVLTWLASYLHRIRVRVTTSNMKVLQLSEVIY